MSRVIQAFAQFLDGAGDPIPNGWLRMLQPNTVNTDKDTFKDSSETILNTNPVQLDAEGRCPDVFGTGPYRVILYTNDELLNQPSEQIAVFDPVGGAQGVSDFNDYDASATYAEFAIVKASDGDFYESLIPNNINNDPTSSPSAWKRITFLEYYNATISYSIGDRAIDSINGIQYISLTDSNLGNQPSTDGGVNWDNFAVYASAAEVRTEINAGLVEIAAAGDDELAQIAAAGDAELVDIAAAGDDELAQIAAAGDAEIAAVIAEGDTQDTRIETEGDTQYNRVISAGSAVNKSVRQAYLSGPDLEATPGTVETAATKTGDLRNTYHDLGMDLLTGSRGGMVIEKGKGVIGHLLQSSLLTENRSYLYTNLTNAEATIADGLQQFTANGLQLSGWTQLTSANLAAFQTTHKAIIDGIEWHYNPTSGFAMWKYVGTGASRNIQHPMGKAPMFIVMKGTYLAQDHYTSRFGTTDIMTLNSTNPESSVTNVGVHTDTYISIFGGGSNNTTGENYFGWGWFGDPLDDLEVGMRGERGVTAVYNYTGGSGAMSIDTGITDIQCIIKKSKEFNGPWLLFNKAAGFDRYTELNNTSAEQLGGGVTVTGSVVERVADTEDVLIIVIGSTADRPDNFLKNGVKSLRKVGTADTVHRVDLGAAFSGGDNGGMFFGRGVGSVLDNHLFDTIMGAGVKFETTTDNPQSSAISGVQTFLSTGVQLGASGVINPAALAQYTAFNTTHKITTADGINWWYNPLTGFAMCEYIGDAVAGRTLTHPMGKLLRMGWFKQRDIIRDWPVYLDSYGPTHAMFLNDTLAATNVNYFFNSRTTDSVIYLGSDNAVNQNAQPYRFYGWFGDDLSHINTGLAGEEGVSAFWQYTGGSGAMSVDTGIPNISVMIAKNSNVVGDWYIYNLEAGTYYRLNTTAVEVASIPWTIEGSVVSWAGSADTLEFVAFGSKADTGVDNDVILPASVSAPAIVAMANGFDTNFGQVDIIESLVASQTLNVTGAAGKKFIVLKSDGLMYVASSRPTYERDFVPYANGLYTYDIDRAKMYNNGVAEPGVVIGECMLDALGNVYDIKTYARGDIWVSDWWAWLASSTFYFDNPFGHKEILADVIGLDTDNDRESDQYYYENGGSFYGTGILTLDDTLRVDTYTAPNFGADELKIVARRNF